jgi:hypothetical protein
VSKVKVRFIRAVHHDAGLLASRLQKMRIGLTFVVLLLLTSCTCGSNPPSQGDGGSCMSPLTLCSASCVDVKLDDANCGACGAKCSDSEACAGSRCYPRMCTDQVCSPSQVCLSDFCTDRACFGVACPADQVCAGGKCYPNACGAMSCPVTFVCLENMCVEGSCVGVACPAGSACKNGKCGIDTCANAVADGTESDVDCGGACATCIPGKKCKADGDCASDSCKQGFCQAPACTDGKRNGAEGDVDCGGACPLCGDGKTCAMGVQCGSGSCVMGVCTAPTCTDGVKNGAETDLDCGGGCATACGDGKACGLGSDCTSGRCTQKICVPLQCTDGMKNGTETDVDCGGSCPGCAATLACMANTDCASKLCTAGKKCTAANCSDLAQNQAETDVDCGGTCAACNPGQGCATGADCASKVCNGATKKCSAPSCSDGVKNNGESDLDCGGAANSCPRCGAGKACTIGGDCASAQCTTMACTVPPVFPLANQTSIDRPYGVTTGDLDNDGKQDFVVSDPGNFTFAIFWGQGDGGFTQTAGPVVSGTVMGQNVDGPRNTAIADFNGDGTPDLITARQQGTNWCVLTVILGSGSRMFQQPLDAVDQTLPAVGCGEMVVAGKFDSDNFADVLVTSALGEKLVGFLWSGVMTWPPAAAKRMDGIGATAAAADLNGDGRLDIVTHQRANSAIGVQLNRGDGGFSMLDSYTVTPGFGPIAIGKLNADAFPDLAVASDSSGVLNVLLNNGDGTFQSAMGLPAGANGVAIGDLDGDGKADLVCGGGTLQILRGLGNGQFGPVEPYGPGSLNGLRWSQSADFNGDGKPDAVGVVTGGQFTGPGAALVYLNATP